MVSDSELVGRLRDFLRTSDLTTTTTATIRRRLEEDFGIDLSDKKAFIREQVDLFLQSQVDNAQENEEEDEGEVNEEEEDDDDEEEEASNGKSTSKRGSKKQNKEVKKRGGGGGFTKLCSLSPELQKFVGVPELARTEVVKQLWNYIREKNLQDPSNRRNIICDDTLRALFAVDCINMFQMNKSLAKHIWPLDSDDDSDDEPKRKEKRQKGGNSGFLAPLPLSDALVKFLGTGESSLSRSEVVKRIWQYIKQNNLQDPSDKRRIISDEKLRELFDVDSFNGFTVSKLLTTHFMKTEH
ncbi:upstream activation factor subunit spp27-like isoform X3 [Camellia sinensis]|uniref:upstream activation factor subunit spp27-like isoform X3 n=1 Tax=Camellia sinensis TaxID=4442 RepID=UPI0010357DC0|nr:upstream activation factor subunit spp27-like isoform X3 [Camellia sinensis]